MSHSSYKSDQEQNPINHPFKVRRDIEGKMKSTIQSDQKWNSVKCLFNVTYRTEFKNHPHQEGMTSTIKMDIRLQNQEQNSINYPF